MEKTKQNKILKIIIVALVAIIAFLGFNYVNNSKKVSLDQEIYRSHFYNTNYQDKVVYCIGHKSPDVDTTISSIVMSNLLNKLGIKSEPRVTGSINPTTKFVLEAFGVEEPKILEDATDTQLWLVDHSSYSQAVNNADKARIVGITDHHSLGDISTAEVVNVSAAKANSTATLIYQDYVECGVEIDKQMASLMVAAIIDDSFFLANELNELDKQAYDDLLKKSEIKNVDDFISNMKDAACNHEGKSDKEIYYLDYKDYDVDMYSYGIGCITVRKIEDIEPMANRINAFLEEEIKNSDKDFLVYMINDVDINLQYVGFVSQEKELVNDLVNTAFTDMEQLVEIKDNSLILQPTLSRKYLVPYITEYLNKIKLF